MNFLGSRSPFLKDAGQLSPGPVLAQAWLIMLSLPELAFAEVMDKEPSLAMVCSVGVLCAGAGFLVSRFKPVLLVAVIPVALILATSQLFEVNDPHVGEAIRNEAGYLYILSSYVQPVLVFVAIVVGISMRRAKLSSNARKGTS